MQHVSRSVGDTILTWRSSVWHQDEKSGVWDLSAHDSGPCLDIQLLCIHGCADTARTVAFHHQAGRLIFGAAGRGKGS